MSDKKTYRSLITEAKKDTIVVGWGRFNPPTVGHEKLIEKLASEASSRGADYRVYPTKTADPKKNPLSFPQKVKFMRAMFPKHARKISPDKKLNTLIKAAQALEKEGYSNLVLVAGSDRIREFKALLSKYNGQEYNFDKVDVVSAGERDPDAEGVAGMSASKMRAAAASKDFKSFKKGVPRGFKGAKALFDAVRKGMQLTEETQELEELTKKQKAALTAAGAVVAAKALKSRKKGKDDPDPEKIEKEPEVKSSEDGYVGGSRFNRLLRFGLSPEGTSDIPLTKRAFKNMEKSGPNPLLRDKIFQVIDKTFDYLLTDDILYNRFVVLLHRKELFGENAMKTFEDLNTELKETAGTSVLPDNHENPSQVNYVAKFSNATMAKEFIRNMAASKMGSVTWISSDGTEIQFIAYKSSVGHEVNRGSQLSAGSDVQLVQIVAKYGGSLNKFEGDVREGIVDSNEIERQLTEGLQKKADKSGIPYDIILEVYARGFKEWKISDISENMTPQQWAFARVNSFCSGGKTITEDDADLWEEYLNCIPLSEMDELFDQEFSAAEALEEKSPPSAKAERFIKKNKDSFKKQYGDGWEQALYSTAWKMHKKHWEEVNENFESEFTSINELFEREVGMTEINETGNKYTKASDREWGTDTSIRAYKADTPGEAPDVPYDALDQRYAVDNMLKNNQMPEPFHKQVEKKESD